MFTLTSQPSGRSDMTAPITILFPIWVEYQFPKHENEDADIILSRKRKKKTKKTTDERRRGLQYAPMVATNFELARDTFFLFHL